MAHNAPATYGLTISTRDDADEFFSTVDGIEGIAQDLYHRFTNDTVLGPGGEDWGKDVTKFAGMPAAQLARRGILLQTVAEQDPRIDHADCKVSAAQINFRGTLYTGKIDITCYTALGPFRRVFGFNASTVADITATLEEDEQ
jgi:hypothetical protein